MTMNEKDEAACKEAWAKYTGSKAWPKSIEFAAGFAAAIEYARGKQEPVAVDHSGLIKRIDAAIERVTQGRGLMSIPADPRSDVDLVLSECKALLQGENPPFWASDFHPPQPVQPAVAQGEAVVWVNSANLKSAAISQERGGPFEQHTWSESETAYHDVPLRVREASAVAVNEQLLEALKKAEASLSDIGDAEREDGDDLAWCEERAAQDLPIIRASLAAAKGGAL